MEFNKSGNYESPQVAKISEQPDMTRLLFRLRSTIDRTIEHAKSINNSANGFKDCRQYSSEYTRPEPKPSSGFLDVVDAEIDRLQCVADDLETSAKALRSIIET